jgi:hypothetical protein
MAIPKLSLAPRISDHVLADLSVKDHLKYLWLWNKYNILLKKSYEKESPINIARMCLCLDWFRQINYLFVTHHKLLGVSYIRDTWPSEEWPNDNLGTINAVEYAYQKQVDAVIPDIFRYYYFHILSSAYSCTYCGSTVPRGQAVLKRGLLSCRGCTTILKYPIGVKLIVQSGFEDDIVNKYIQLVGRSVDTNKVPSFCHAFLLNRKSSCEADIHKYDKMKIPVIVLQRRRVR